MSDNTKIEYAHATINWWAGCTQVSPACDNCYAKPFAKRLFGVDWGTDAPRRQFQGAYASLMALDRKAKRLGRPLVVFHNSLSDFFDNAVPGQWRIEAIRGVMDTPNLIHLLVTKRIGNAAAMLEQAFRAVTGQREGWADNVLPNVWLIATISSQAEADRDIAKLLATPAAKRGLSMEPLLLSVDICRWIATAKVTCKKCAISFWLHEADPCEHSQQGSWTLACPNCGDCKCEKAWTPPGERLRSMQPPQDWIDRKVGRFDQVHPTIPIKSAIDWVIVGGESGANARPMHPDWVRSLRDQCQAAGVPFFFKQWGEWLPWHHFTDSGIDDEAVQTRLKTREWVDGQWIDVGRPDIWASKDGEIDDMECVGHVGKKAAGRLLDGRTWDEDPS